MFIRKMQQKQNVCKIEKKFVSSCQISNSGKEKESEKASKLEHLGMHLRETYTRL